MVDFRNVIQTMFDIGVYDIVLPFLLVYVIIFAVLEKSKIFKVHDGDNKHVKNVNAIIAFVFAMFFVAAYNTVSYVQNFIVQMVFLIIFLLCIMIILGMIFGEDFHKMYKDADGNVRGWIVWTISLIVLAIAIGVLFWILGVWDWIDQTLGSFNSTDTFWSAFAILALVGILVWVTRGSSDEHSD